MCHPTKRRDMCVLLDKSSISASVGFGAFKLAASRTLGSSLTSLLVLRKILPCPRIQETAKLMSPCSSKGSYQVSAVWRFSPHGPLVRDLMVWTATTLSSHVFSRELN